MIYKTNKKHLVVDLKQMDDIFMLNTIEGESYGMAGDYVATNLCGDQFIVLESDYGDFVEVYYKEARERLNKKKRDQYEEGLKRIHGIE